METPKDYPAPASPASAASPDPGDVRWLSPAEQEAWRAYVDLNQRLVDLLDRQLQSGSNLPFGYYEILVRLSERPERSMRMGDLAAATRTSPSRISHAVKQLEKKKWVRREDFAGDGRGQVAVLTDTGFAVLSAAAPGHVTEVRKLLVDVLTPEEMAELGRISHKVLTSLGPA